MAVSETPLPSGSISFERAESTDREMRFRSSTNESTLFFTSSAVRLRLGPYTFSFSQGRSSGLNLDTDFMEFVPPVGVDQVHLRQFVVAVPQQLFHSLSLGMQPFFGGVLDLQGRPLFVLLNLVALGRIRNLAGTADTRKLGRTVAVANALPADNISQGTGFASRAFVYPQ